VQTYEEAFARIMDATNIRSIDELVDTFINAEDKNFTLFNFVNELTSEIEKLEEQISDIKAEVDKYRGQDMNSDHQRKKILKDLEEKLGRTETKAEQYDAKFAQSTKILSSLKDGIHAIFTNIGCNMNGVSEVLGTGGVTEGNIMTYLGLIEQRTNEMLGMYTNVVKQHEHPGGEHEVHRSPSSIVGPVSAPGTTHIAILPPTTGDEYEEEEESEDEDETRPLTRDELKAKAQKTMSKKELKKPKKTKPKK
jgi:TolA-binding protein